MIWAMIFTKSLCLVFFRPAETLIMLWLHGNGFIKGTGRAKITNAVGLGED